MIEELPTYTTERYFLLSELEQKFQLRFVDVLTESGNLCSESNVKDPLIFVYKLWVFESCSQEKLFCNVNEIIGLMEKYQSKEEMFANKKLCIVIDLLLPRGKKVVDEVLETVKAILEHESWKRFSDCFVLIAAFDHAAACPGIEFCYNCAERISPGYVSDSLVGVLFAQSRAELMGADPGLEPDAVSGVYQVYCTTEVGGVEKCLAKLSEEASSKKASLSSKTKQSERQTSVFPHIVLLVLLFAIVFALFPLRVSGRASYI